MRNGTYLILAGLQATLGLSACHSLPDGRQASVVLPAEQVRHGGTSRRAALYAIGRYHQGQICYDQAIESYRRLLAEFPEYAEAHNALGIIFAKQGRFDAAIEELETAVGQAPDSASIRNNLGYAYMLRGDTATAIVALEAAARIDPANRRVRENLQLAMGRATPPSPQEPAASLRAEGKATPAAAGMRLIEVAEGTFALQEVPAPESLIEEGAGDGHQAAGRLEIANGNGVNGLARKMAGYLEEPGLAPKTRLTNVLPYRLPASEIQYRPGFETQARKLRLALHSGVPLVASMQLRSDVQVRLLLGQDIRAVPEARSGALGIKGSILWAAVDD